MPLCRALGLLVSAAVVAMAMGGCSGPSDTTEKNDRTAMRQGTVTINGHTFHVALAMTPEERRIGLMNVSADELGQDEGMLFAFAGERPLGFWMKNTIIPLDIAFIDREGRIVTIHTMKALDTSSYLSKEPAQYALEVHAGRFASLGIQEGDQVRIQETVLKP